METTFLMCLFTASPIIYFCSTSPTLNSLHTISPKLSRVGNFAGSACEYVIKYCLRPTRRSNPSIAKLLILLNFTCKNQTVHEYEMQTIYFSDSLYVLLFFKNVDILYREGILKYLVEIFYYSGYMFIFFC